MAYLAGDPPARLLREVIDLQLGLVLPEHFLSRLRRALVARLVVQPGV